MLTTLAAGAAAMQRSPAFPRNRDPIAKVMAETGFSALGALLELGCGPGEHAVDLAARWGADGPTIQPTDRAADALASADAHAAAAGCGARVLKAVRVDVGDAAWDVAAGAYDGCYAINVVHIMPRSAIPTFFAGAGRALRPGGSLGIYDTWTFDGAYVGPNNERFDASLRAQGYGGVASIEACDAAAAAAGLERTSLAYLPANNQWAVYSKRA